MTETPETGDLPPSLRFLRMLVIILMVTMIAGVITLVALLVTRLPSLTSSRPVLPPALAMPEGTTPTAVTMGPGWVAVVTTDDRILIFGADGTLWQEVGITRPTP